MHHSRNEKPQLAYFEKHCHTTYEIVYVVEGEGYYMYDGERNPIAPDTVAILLPCKFHYTEPREDSPYERYVISFAKEDIPAEVQACLSAYGSAVMPLSEEKAPLIRQIFERLENLFDISEDLRDSMARFLLGEMLVLMMNNAPPAPSREEKALGAMVIKYINERITSKISLDDISRDFFISKSYLCRAFKEYNKISVLGYINSKRVAMARQLIEEGQNASVAAYSVGFADYSTFFRAYKRITGKAPTSKESGWSNTETAQ